MSRESDYLVRVAECPPGKEVCDACRGEGYVAHNPVPNFPLRAARAAWWSVFLLFATPVKATWDEDSNEPTEWSTYVLLIGLVATLTWAAVLSIGMSVKDHSPFWRWVQIWWTLAPVVSVLACWSTMGALRPLWRTYVKALTEKLKKE